MNSTVREIADRIQGKVIGDETVAITGITNIESPSAGMITFAQNLSTARKLESSPLACLIVPAEVTESTKPLIQTENPKLAWASLLEFFHPEPPVAAGISPLASIADSAHVGRNVTIEPFVCVAPGAVIGDGTVLRSHVFIGEQVTVGRNCLLHSGVKAYRRSQIGNQVIIHAGAVIGADGFGYVATPGGQMKVPQVGNVIIEDDVEIGASTVIDRATIGSTRIGPGTKIDNLVQIAHNVRIGSHCAISSQTGISGSSKIGSFVIMGGKTGLGDHVEIGDQVMIGAGAGFPSGKKIPSKQIVFGQPARPYAQARKQIAAQLRSAEMYQEIKTLRKKLKALEERLSDTSSPLPE